MDDKRVSFKLVKQKVNYGIKEKVKQVLAAKD
jgi:hypothetical protein